jgi:hypothetical protein
MMCLQDDMKDKNIATPSQSKHVATSSALLPSNWPTALPAYMQYPVATTSSLMLPFVSFNSPPSVRHLSEIFETRTQLRALSVDVFQHLPRQFRHAHEGRMYEFNIHAHDAALTISTIDTHEALRVGVGSKTFTRELSSFDTHKNELKAVAALKDALEQQSTQLALQK